MIAMSASVPTWNSHADATQALRQRPPSRATGAPSSTTSVARATGRQIQSRATSAAPSVRPAVAEHDLAEVVEGDLVAQHVAAEPRPAPVAQLHPAGQHVGQHGHDRHHQHREAVAAGRLRGRPRRPRRRAGPGVERAGVGGGGEGDHQQVQGHQVLGVQHVPPAQAEAEAGQRRQPERRAGEPPAPAQCEADAGRHAQQQAHAPRGRGGGGPPAGPEDADRLPAVVGQAGLGPQVGEAYEQVDGGVAADERSQHGQPGRGAGATSRSASSEASRRGAGMSQPAPLDDGRSAESGTGQAACTVRSRGWRSPANQSTAS